MKHRLYPKSRAGKFVYIIGALLLSLPLLLNKAFASEQAQPIPDFDATFLVHAYGVDLGKSRHQLHCEQRDCVLETLSKPEGWVKIFFKDSAQEKIQLQQTAQSILWQGYQKQATRHKGDDAKIKSTTFELESSGQQIVYLEKKRQWPWHPGVFDATSIAYAIQWYALNHKDLATAQLILQTTKEQYPIKFSILAHPETLKLEYGKEPSQKYRFGNQRFEIDLWLLPEKHYFPGKLRIYDREEDKTIVLVLEKAPKLRTS
ncbi:DUF3108 domain-containing protein [Thiomicrorhabdus sp. 6S3-12]|uniref:DUF3108 domain-containing protein n=1 Tax=Thiomicrorhabdus sp. 6S3-12 TaxID=2819681 RepID=UPI001AAC597B|nr:DUF3108 domain-containing protein [Thiomicrorhabdus sp. 6S3-12]MBO1924242.1 DUF3108 domain-containing protein [Thiomicrorhabdus sp. 6S3-12]